jgi:hypothetical protein
MGSVKKGCGVMQILEIYKKSWHLLITKRTLLLWGMAYVLCEYAIRFFYTSSIDTYCLTNLLGLAITLFILIYLGAFILVIEDVLQDASTSFREIWMRVKKILAKLFLVELSLGCLSFLLMLCFLVAINLANSFIPAIPDDMASRFTLALFLVFWFASPIGVFCLYGVVLHRTGIMQSIRHGLSVFSMNWMSSLAIYMLSYAPRLALYAIVFLVEELNGRSPGLLSIQATANNPQYIVGTILISGLVYTLSSVSLQVAYHHFIDSFDYPILKQITPGS